MPVPYFRLEGDISSNVYLPSNVVYMPTVTVEQPAKTKSPDRAIMAVASLGVILALVSLSLQVVFLAEGFGSKYKATLISGICIASLCLCYNIAGVFAGKAGTKASTAFFAFMCAMNVVLALVSFPVYSFILSDCANNREGNICGERLSIWPILLTALAICSLMQLVFAIVGAVFSCKFVLCCRKKPQTY